MKRLLDLMDRSGFTVASKGERVSLSSNGETIDCTAEMMYFTDLVRKAVLDDVYEWIDTQYLERGERLPITGVLHHVKGMKRNRPENIWKY